MAEDFGFHKTDEVAASLDPDVNGVIVGFDMKINYLKMSKASIVVSRAGDNAVFVATNTDEQFPVRPGVFMPGSVVVNARSLIKSLLCATCDINGRKFDVHSV